MKILTTNNGSYDQLAMSLVIVHDDWLPALVGANYDGIFHHLAQMCW